MKHDKNLVVKKDIQVSFYKILRFCIVITYIKVFATYQMTYKHCMYCNIWLGIHIATFDKYGINNYHKIWHCIYYATFNMVLIL